MARDAIHIKLVILYRHFQVGGLRSAESTRTEQKYSRVRVVWRKVLALPKTILALVFILAISEISWFRPPSPIVEPDRLHLTVTRQSVWFNRSRGRGRLLAI